MEGQREWTARAAQSYQELARVFSAYVTGKMEQECGCGESTQGEYSCETCPRISRIKQTAYNQMLDAQY